MDRFNSPYTFCLQTPQLGCMYQPTAVCCPKNGNYQQRTYYGFYRTETSPCNHRKTRPRGIGTCSPRSQLSDRTCPKFCEPMNSDDILEKLKCIDKCWNVKVSRDVAVNTQPKEKGTSTQTQETRIITADSLENLLPMNQRFLIDGDLDREEEEAEEEKEKKQSSKKKSAYCSKGGKSRSRSRKRQRLRGGANEKKKKSPYTQATSEEISPKDDVVLYFEASSLMKVSPIENTEDTLPKSETRLHNSKQTVKEQSSKTSVKTDSGKKQFEMCPEYHGKSVKKYSKEKNVELKEDPKRKCTIL